MSGWVTDVKLTQVCKNPKFPNTLLHCNGLITFIQVSGVLMMYWSCLYTSETQRGNVGQLESRVFTSNTIQHFFFSCHHGACELEVPQLVAVDLRNVAGDGRRLLASSALRMQDPEHFCHLFLFWDRGRGRNLFSTGKDLWSSFLPAGLDTAHLSCAATHIHVYVHTHTQSGRGGSGYSAGTFILAQL